MAVVLATDRILLGHAPPGGTPHPERAARLEAVLAGLERGGVFARMGKLASRDATDAEILAVHEPAVLATIEYHAEAGGGWIDADSYVGPDSLAAARRAAGAVLAASEAVLAGEARRAFAAVRPPGHHATRERAMGFCLLNNVAITAAAALGSGIGRLAIVDWDLHHGNGTQAVFDADPRVLYVSTHAAPYYPGSGAFEETGSGAAAGTKVNVPLPHGAGDTAFLAAYEQIAVPALDRFEPELVLVSCGWDAHARDPLGVLAVSTAGYTQVARLIIESAERHSDGRLVAALEGGYDEHALSWCAQALGELLLGKEPTPDPEQGVGRPEAVMDIPEVIARARAAVDLD